MAVSPARSGRYGGPLRADQDGHPYALSAGAPRRHHPHLHPPELRTLLSLPVKLAGVGTPNPTNPANDNHTTSSVCTSVLTKFLLDSTSLIIPDNQAAMHEGRTTAQSIKQANFANVLRSRLVPMDAQDARRTTRNPDMGAWISVQPTLINGLFLSKDEWRDRMRRRYGLGLVYLPPCCDGCGSKFSIEHALACKKGGLVVGRHSEVR